jgi:hypothetical protein
MRDVKVLRGGVEVESLANRYRDKVFQIKCCSTYTLVIPESFGRVLHIEAAEDYCIFRRCVQSFVTLRVKGETPKFRRNSGWDAPKEYFADLPLGLVEFSIHKPFQCCDVGRIFLVITGEKHRVYVFFRIPPDERSQTLSSSLFTPREDIW